MVCLSINNFESSETQPNLYLAVEFLFSRWLDTSQVLEMFHAICTSYWTPAEGCLCVDLPLKHICSFMDDVNVNANERVPALPDVFQAAVLHTWRCTRLSDGLVGPPVSESQNYNVRPNVNLLARISFTNHTIVSLTKKELLVMLLWLRMLLQSTTLNCHWKENVWASRSV